MSSRLEENLEKVRSEILVFILEEKLGNNDDLACHLFDTCCVLSFEKKSMKNYYLDS